MAPRAAEPVPVARLTQTEGFGMFTIAPASQPPAAQRPDFPQASPPPPAAPAPPASPFAGFKPRLEADSSHEAPAPFPRRSSFGSALEFPAMGRLRWAVLVLASLLFFLVGLVTGQILALKGRNLAGPVFHQPAAVPAGQPMAAPIAATPAPPSAPEPAVPGPSPASDPAEKPARSGVPAPPPGSGASRAELEAFLDATHWEDRAEHVLDSPGVLDRMKAHAEESGDGPIAYTGIGGPTTAPGLHQYIVTTPTLSQGFPVTLFQQGDEWRIDWDMFREFHDDAFYHFAAGTRGDEGVFHVFVKPGAATDNGFSAYQLTAPIEGRSYGAFVKKGSPVESKLAAVFKNGDDADDPLFQQLMRGVGIPVVLELSSSQNQQGQRFLMIDDLVSRYWGPDA
ncbi:hypothetical protein [Haloferula sargassicola]|uniref:Uncharacterized protein n=1 Tax=Haloferula sargassicola TaxID=490096 RepID=A0ABP9UT61_9BACT